MSSPADIIAKFLQDQGVATIPSGIYPVFVSQLPQKPNNAMATFDGKTRPDGRLMLGETIFHPNVQIIIRSSDYRTAWSKAEEIKQKLEGINKTVVNLSGTDYTIQASSFTTNILSLGLDEDKTRRHLLSLNFKITLI